VGVRSAPAAVAEPAVRGEQDVPGMTAFLDGLKWDAAGLVAVIVQVRASPAPSERAAHHAPTGAGSQHRTQRPARQMPARRPVFY